jgi:hypothetical protein
MLGRWLWVLVWQGTRLVLLGQWTVQGSVQGSRHAIVDQRGGDAVAALAVVADVAGNNLMICRARAAHYARQPNKPKGRSGKYSF